MRRRLGDVLTGIGSWLVRRGMKLNRGGILLTHFTRLHPELDPDEED